MDQSRSLDRLAADTARFLIRLYQFAAAGFAPRCRFAPSCSVYCREAFAMHGFYKGLAYGVRRLLKCHPWNPGGYDPIPTLGESNAA